MADEDKNNVVPENEDIIETPEDTIETMEDPDSEETESMPDVSYVNANDCFFGGTGEYNPYAKHANFEGVDSGENFSDEYIDEHVRHYSGPLGTFTYDPSQFQMRNVVIENVDDNGNAYDDKMWFLKYVGDKTDGSDIEIPKGIKSCNFMFVEPLFRDDLTHTLKSMPEIPDGVESAVCMFANCEDMTTARGVLPSSLKNMSGMFTNCSSCKVFPNRIPANVESADYAFSDCREMVDPPVFERDDEKGVKSVRGVFANCAKLRNKPDFPEKTVKDSHGSTYGCTGLDIAAEKRAEKRFRKDLKAIDKKYHKKMISKGFASNDKDMTHYHNPVKRALYGFKHGISFWAQVGAMRRSGMGIINSIVTTNISRSTGQFGKDLKSAFYAFNMNRTDHRGYPKRSSQMFQRLMLRRADKLMRDNQKLEGERLDEIKQLYARKAVGGYSAYQKPSMGKAMRNAAKNIAVDTAKTVGKGVGGLGKLTARSAKTVVNSVVDVLHERAYKGLIDDQAAETVKNGDLVSFAKYSDKMVNFYKSRCEDDYKSEICELIGIRSFKDLGSNHEDMDAVKRRNVSKGLVRSLNAILLYYSECVSEIRDHTQHLDRDQDEMKRGLDRCVGAKLSAWFNCAKAVQSEYGVFDAGDMRKIGTVLNRVPCSLDENGNPKYCDINELDPEYYSSCYGDSKSSYSVLKSFMRRYKEPVEPVSDSRSDSILDLESESKPASVFKGDKDGWHNLEGGCRVRLTEDGRFEIGAQPGYEEPTLPDVSDGWNTVYPFKSRIVDEVKSVVVVDKVYANPNSTSLFENFVDCEFVDVSKLDTSKVVKMDVMFAHNSAKEIKGLETWDTSNVDSMRSVFWHCRGLEIPPDVGSWDVSNVKNMVSMFEYCGSVGLKVPPDVKDWNTGKVENMSYMFAGCSSFTTPPAVGEWDTGKLMDVSYMFTDCTSFDVIPDVIQWREEDRIRMNMSHVFDRCGTEDARMNTVLANYLSSLNNTVSVAKGDDGKGPVNSNGDDKQKKSGDTGAAGGQGIKPIDGVKPEEKGPSAVDSTSSLQGVNVFGADVNDAGEQVKLDEQLAHEQSSGLAADIQARIIEQLISQHMAVVEQQAAFIEKQQKIIDELMRNRNRAKESENIFGDIINNSGAQNERGDNQMGEI